MDHLVVLKNEQTARIVLRDTALYVHLGAIIGVYAAIGQAGSNQSLVEVIRTSSVALSIVMFSIYLSNDYYVSKLGRFIRSFGDDQFQGWEQFHRQGIRYRIQKSLRTIIVVMLFGVWTAVQTYEVWTRAESPNTWIAAACWLVILVELGFFLTMEFVQDSVASPTPESATARTASELAESPAAPVVKVTEPVQVKPEPEPPASTVRNATAASDGRV
jgi:hypothetical protein